MRGIVPATVLITLGVLFMLDNLNVASFDRTWPVFLIALGVAIAIRRSLGSAPAECCAPPQPTQPLAPPPQEVKRG
jgi:cell wall-active antibiotic response 4TMS protein YvqF